MTGTTSGGPLALLGNRHRIIRIGESARVLRRPRNLLILLQRDEFAPGMELLDLVCGNLYLSHDVALEHKRVTSGPLESSGQLIAVRKHDHIGSWLGGIPLGPDHYGLLEHRA